MEIDHSLFICSSVELTIRDFEPHRTNQIDESLRYKFLVLLFYSRVSKNFHKIHPGISFVRKISYLGAMTAKKKKDFLHS